MRCHQCKSNDCIIDLCWKDLFEESKKYKDSNLPPEKIRIEVAQTILYKSQTFYDVIVPGCIARLFHKLSESDYEIEDLGYPTLDQFFPFRVKFVGDSATGSNCIYCKSNPCHVSTYGELLNDKAIDLMNCLSKIETRRCLYSIYQTEIVDGLFSSGNVKFIVPSCMIKFIKEECQDGKR